MGFKTALIRVQKQRTPRNFVYLLREIEKETDLQEMYNKFVKFVEVWDFNTDSTLRLRDRIVSTPMQYGMKNGQIVISEVAPHGQQGKLLNKTALRKNISDLKKYFEGVGGPAGNSPKSTGKEEAEHYVIVEFNEYGPGPVNDYKGRLVDLELLREIQSLDNKVNQELESYYKFYFDFYTDGKRIMHARFDVGDGLAANNYMYEAVEQFLRTGILD